MGISMVVAPHLIGRAETQAEIAGLLSQAAVRVITLVGTGGVGKTTLARAVLAAHAARIRTLWVELTPMSHVDQFLPALLSEAGVKTRDDFMVLANSTPIVLFVDNCEHLLDVALVLADLLARCSELNVVATSRTPLDLRDEHVVAVAPLAVPPVLSPLNPHGAARMTTDDMLAIPAVALFWARAQQVAAGLTATSANIEAVADICRLLDGLPLALELAAAQLRMFGPVRLAERLRANLADLSSSRRDMPERHRTIRATLEWGLALLTDAARALFTKLAVFGTAWFDVEAVLAVCDGDNPDALLDDLDGLVRQSFLLSDTSGDGERIFRLLSTLHVFAEERLSGLPEREQVRRAHALYFLEWAEHNDQNLLGAGQAEWLKRFDRAYPNMAAAQDWAMALGDVEIALRYVAILWRYWEFRDLLVEGRRRGKLAFDVAVGHEDAVDASIWADALHGRGTLYMSSDASDETVRYLQHAVEIRRRLGQTEKLVRSLSNLSGVLWEAGRLQEARIAITEAIAIKRKSTPDASFTICLINAGAIELNMGNYSHAESWSVQGLVAARQLQTTLCAAKALDTLADLSRHNKAYAQSLRHLTELEALFQERDDIVRQAATIARQALIHVERGDVGMGIDHLQRGLRFVAGRDMPRYIYIVSFLDATISILDAVGRYSDAAYVLGALDVLRQQINVPVQPIEAPMEMSRREGLQQRLGARFGSAHDNGAAVAVPHMLEMCRMLCTSLEIPTKLAVVSSAPIRIDHSSVADLTKREREVLALIAEHYTNQQIAERLTLSLRTVDTHVGNILAKLEVSDRRAAVHYARSVGLLAA